MAKVYVDTKNMSKEDLVQLNLDKDKKIEELEHFEFLVLKAYGNNKVSDTSCIESGKSRKFADEMEIIWLSNKQQQRGS